MRRVLGTTVEHDDLPASAAQSGVQRRALLRRSVLVVDRDAVARSWIVRALLREGWDVEVAGHVDDVVAICQRVRIDALVVATDEDPDGRDASHVLEAVYPHRRGLAIIGRTRTSAWCESFVRSFGFSAVAVAPLAGRRAIPGVVDALRRIVGPGPARARVR
jgi:AmiR/NasT family two-component response regulator